MKFRFVPLFAVAGALWAQAPKAGSPAPAPTAPNTGVSPTNPNPNTNTNPINQPRSTFPTNPNTNNNPFPERRGNIFLSGRVMLSDGTPPPITVTIERVCGTVVRPEAHTNTKGHFSFELGGNSGMIADASTSGAGVEGFPGQNNSGFNESQLMNCEIRANLPGYQSQSVSLAGRRIMDNPDIGTIILSRMGNVEGFVISATEAMAPKDAKKAYAKGHELLRKNKLEEAQRELEKATSLYPKYAYAWNDLGYLYDKKKQPEESRKAYESALGADSKYMSPYLPLTALYSRDKEWQKAADLSAKAIKLDPFSFPLTYFYNAVANFNLNKLDAAEKSALEAQKLDKDHRNPKNDHLLGVILAQKHDYSGATSNMKRYLQFAPKAADAELVQRQIAEMEKAKEGNQ